MTKARTLLATPEESKTGINEIVVLWDYDNAAIPKGVSPEVVAANITHKARSYGSNKVTILVFTAMRNLNEKTMCALQSHDAEIIPVFSEKIKQKSEQVDKRIISRMSSLAWENNKLFILISGDGGFSEYVHELIQANHLVVLFYPNEPALNLVQNQNLLDAVPFSTLCQSPITTQAESKTDMVNDNSKIAGKKDVIIIWDFDNVPISSELSSKELSTLVKNPLTKGHKVEVSVFTQRMKEDHKNMCILQSQAVNIIPVFDSPYSPGKVEIFNKQVIKKLTTSCNTLILITGNEKFVERMSALKNNCKLILLYPHQAPAKLIESNLWTEAKPFTSLFSPHTEIMKPLLDRLMQNFNGWFNLEFVSDRIAAFLNVEEELRKSYFLKMVEMISNWKKDDLTDEKILTSLASLFHSFGQDNKNELSKQLLAALSLHPDNYPLLALLSKCFPDELFKEINETIGVLCQTGQVSKESKKVDLAWPLIDTICILSHAILQGKRREISFLSKLETLIVKLNESSFQLILPSLVLKLYAYQGADLLTLWDAAVKYKIVKDDSVFEWLFTQFCQLPSKKPTLAMLLEQMDKRPIIFMQDIRKFICRIIPVLSQDDSQTIYHWCVKHTALDMSSEFKQENPHDEKMIRQIIYDYLLELVTAFPDAGFIDYEKVYQLANQTVCERDQRIKLSLLAAHKISSAFASKAYTCCFYIQVKFAVFKKLDKKSQERERPSLIEYCHADCYLEGLADPDVYNHYIKSPLYQQRDNYFKFLLLLCSLKTNISSAERTNRLLNSLNFDAENINFAKVIKLDGLQLVLDAQLPIDANKPLLKKICKLKAEESSDKLVLNKLLIHIIPKCSREDLVNFAQDIYNTTMKDMHSDGNVLLATLAAHLPKKEVDSKMIGQPSSSVYQPSLFNRSCFERKANSFETSDHLAENIIEDNSPYSGRARYSYEYNEAITFFLPSMIPHVSLEMAKTIFIKLFGELDNLYTEGTFSAHCRFIPDFQPMFAAMHDAKSFPDQQFRTLFNILLQCDKYRFDRMNYDPGNIYNKLIDFIAYISDKEIRSLLDSVDIKKHSQILVYLKELITALLAHCDYKTAQGYVLEWQRQINNLKLDPSELLSATIFLNKVSLQALNIGKQVVHQTEAKSDGLSLNLGCTTFNKAKQNINSGTSGTAKPTSKMSP
jgi:hypothetical protein